MKNNREKFKNFYLVCLQLRIYILATPLREEEQDWLV
jgi:hypothetical protein